MKLEALGGGCLTELGALKTAEPLAQLVEARVEAFPAGRKEIDEHLDVSDARMALGIECLLDALQASRLLSREPANLGQVAGDRQDLAARGLLNRAAKLLWDSGLELSRNFSKLRELAAGLLEDAAQLRHIRIARTQVANA